VQIRVADADSTRAVRRAVLRPTWPPDSPMHGDENADAVLLAAVEDGTVIGTVLILPRPYPHRPELDGAWQLRGMATIPARQGTGIGSRLVCAAIDEARRRGGRLLWCDARTSAVGFYRKNGFVTEGPEFLHDESAIPHYRMWREI
ncbi:MAG TPA: GNAT family N-acetyltransferase, partial [Jatrophihabitans sp.]|nr:GNAT family N-acetyltransferase [Jatrophihabitans sp.]